VRRALELTWRAQARGSLLRSMRGEAGSLAQALELATQPGFGLLMLQPGRERSHLFVIDASGADVVEIEALWKLMRLRQEHAAAVTERLGHDTRTPDPTLDSAAAALRRALVPDAVMERMRSWTSVSFIADEALGQVPFELLVDDEGRRFGDRWDVCHVPSLPLVVAVAERARARRSKPLDAIRARIVAATEENHETAELEAIPADPRLWSRWGALWGTRADVVVGSAGTRAGLLSSGGSGIDILQVVAHGTFDYDRERPAGLRLDVDGVASGAIWCEDIETQPAPALVLLAVCGASRAPVRRGDDGRASIAGSFVLAGSECVITTPFDLRAAEALEYFETVQAAIARGSAPARALREARLELAERGAVPVQDYLVYAWGWGFEPLVSVAIPSVASKGPELSNDATKPGRIWIWIVAIGCAIALAIGIAIRNRRRSASGN
jgi:hypothetical protein